VIFIFFFKPKKQLSTSRRQETRKLTKTLFKPQEPTQTTKDGSPIFSSRYGLYGGPSVFYDCNDQARGNGRRCPFLEDEGDGAKIRTLRTSDEELVQSRG